MAVTTQEIPRDAWRGYFDEFSKTMGTLEATVEVDGEDVGAQIIAERLVLTGITYDSKDDALVIGLDAPGAPPPEDLEHFVYNPTKIWVATGDEMPPTFDIDDAEGHKTILKLETPPALPGG
jgi:hypothetical protein